MLLLFSGDYLSGFCEVFRLIALFDLKREKVKKGKMNNGAARKEC